MNLEDKIIFAVRIKSSIKDSKLQIKNGQSLKLLRLNQVLICPATPSITGRLKVLRSKVAYYYLDKTTHVKEIERLRRYLQDKLKLSEQQIDLNTARYNFGVNSPYKQKVASADATLELYLNTYLYRKKQKK